MKLGSSCLFDLDLRSMMIVSICVFLSSPSHKAQASNIPRNPITGLSISYQSSEGQQCVGKNSVPGSASRVLQQHGVTINGKKSAAFEKGVASAVSMIAAMGKPEYVKGLKISTFPDGRRKGSRGRGTSTSCASYTAGVKNLHIVAGSGACNRNIGQTSATMHILHEMGHSVGLSKGLYRSFADSVNSSNCNLTGYCTHNKSQQGSEHFAEAFAMYIHSPSTVAKYCKSGYDFMRKHVFNGRTSNGGVCKGVAAVNIAANYSSDEKPTTSSTSGGPPKRRIHVGGGGAQIGSLVSAIAPVVTAAMANQQSQPGTNENPEVLQKVIKPTATPTQNVHPTAR